LFSFSINLHCLRNVLFLKKGFLFGQKEALSKTKINENLLEVQIINFNSHKS
jgi:hypothetical protein